MITLTTAQLETWIGQLFWPFLRIGACLMVVPIFGARFVPPQTRLIIAGAIALLIAPLITLPAGLTALSGAGIVITANEVLIGLAMGFILQVIFDSLAMGGQLLSNSMGLSFAFNVDPMRGASTPVLGQFYMLLVTLTFLALDGHLALIRTLVDGFGTLPVGGEGLGRDGLWMVVSWGRQLFSGALAVALPGMTALMVVNLGFGVMSRAAPTLNLFAVGFPITLIFGLVILLAGLPSVQTSFIELIGDALDLVRSLLRLPA
jgi:flagellar biosynthetic protein FliR